MVFYYGSPSRLIHQSSFVSKRNFWKFSSIIQIQWDSWPTLVHILFFQIASCSSLKDRRYLNQVPSLAWKYRKELRKVEAESVLTFSTQGEIEMRETVSLSISFILSPLPLFLSSSLTLSAKEGLYNLV